MRQFEAIENSFYLHESGFKVYMPVASRVERWKAERSWAKMEDLKMRFEDLKMKMRTQNKVFTDQKIPKKPPSCQVRYLLRISYISRHVQFSEVIKN